jgi:hypothetical protein
MICGTVVASITLACDPRRPKYFRNAADDPTYLLRPELLRKWLRMLVGFGAARKTLSITQGLGSPLRHLARAFMPTCCTRKCALDVLSDYRRVSGSSLAFAKPPHTAPQRSTIQPSSSKSLHANGRVTTTPVQYRMVHYAEGRNAIQTSWSRTCLPPDATRRSGCLIVGTQVIVVDQ